MITLKELKIKKEKLMKHRPLTKEEIKVKAQIETLKQVLGVIDEIKLNVGWEEAHTLNELKAKIEGKEDLQSAPRSDSLSGDEGESAEETSGYSESGKSEEYPSADTLQENHAHHTNCPLDTKPCQEVKE